MRAVARVDAQGLYLEDVLIEDGAQLPEGCVERPPDGFHHPRWSGLEWQEGKPASEIVASRRPAKVEEIKRAALTQLADEFPEGLEEAVFLALSALKQILEGMGQPVDARIAEAARIGELALEKREQIKSAQTPEELEGISWT